MPASETRLVNWEKSRDEGLKCLREVIDINSNIMGGTPVLRGTRYSIKSLLAELADGEPISVIASDFEINLADARKILDGLALYFTAGAAVLDLISGSRIPAVIAKKEGRLDLVHCFDLRPITGEWLEEMFGKGPYYPVYWFGANVNYQLGDYIYCAGRELVRPENRGHLLSILDSLRLLSQFKVGEINGS